MAVDINWSYVAGFFDGEGSICMILGGRCKTCIAFTQTQDRGKALLTAIGNFLNTEEESIHWSITSTNRPGKKEMHQLVIKRREDVCCLLRYLLPYLRIKKVEAQDTLRYLKMFPQLQCWEAAKYHTPKGLRERVAA